MPSSSSESPSTVPAGSNGEIVSQQFVPADDFAALAEALQSPAEADEMLPPPQRRRVLPLVLFLTTCASTFFAGYCDWQPDRYLGNPGRILAEHRVAWANGITSDDATAQEVRRRLENGTLYMLCVVGILLAHEMGHFVMTLRHGIPASYPFFIPVPFSPLGTMGAVIAMDGKGANRREMFDVGLAGPLAGLVVAVPIIWYGITHPAAHAVPHGATVFHNPLFVQLMVSWLRPGSAVSDEVIMSPFLMAGWVGLLITGLNMLPVSQLDGGHVAYALFGRRAHSLARALLLGAIAFVIVVPGAQIWTLMVVLVTIIGVDHPPTANDTVDLGWPRRLIGYASLAIPILCFPPIPVS